MQSKIHSAERMAGVRAHYHVYSRNLKTGRVQFNPSWADDPISARADVEAQFRQLRIKNHETIRVVSLTPTFPGAATA